MATISKFYFHDAASTVAGTLPSGALQISGLATAATGDASGARTARTANDVIGTANPDTESTLTAVADTNQQTWGHRRFVSDPLAGQVIATGETWTFSYARSESNTAHHQIVRVVVYVWRPSIGANPQGSTFDVVQILGTDANATGELAESRTGSPVANIVISDGDILVFDVTTVFTQTMATAYNEQFAYDGTTEASTTTCASFVTPFRPLELYGKKPERIRTKFVHLRQNR